ncbi:DUF6009 family protein [Streptomyces alanosinicus]|uniref:DUF6009 family protein n=1 Tax=Streptomyces alanosinicus TaxID=68171 RepID=UPI003570FC59
MRDLAARTTRATRTCEQRDPRSQRIPRGRHPLQPGAASDSDSGLFPRRAFFLLAHDRDQQPHGPYSVGAPGEAVDPRTIQPGKVGAKTPRSQRSQAVQIAPAGR